MQSFQNRTQYSVTPNIRANTKINGTRFMFGHKHNCAVLTTGRLVSICGKAGPADNWPAGTGTLAHNEAIMRSIWSHLRGHFPDGGT